MWCFYYYFQHYRYSCQLCHPHCPLLTQFPGLFASLLPLLSHCTLSFLYMSLALLDSVGRVRMALYRLVISCLHSIQLYCQSIAYQKHNYTDIKPVLRRTLLAFILWQEHVTQASSCTATQDFLISSLTLCISHCCWGGIITYTHTLLEITYQWVQELEWGW